MKRTLALVVVALLMAGTAFAQCGMMAPAPAAGDDGPVSPCMRGMQQGMQMRQSPMASMAGALDTAVWGEFVYVLQGNMLEKRDMDGNAATSVQLADMAQTMEQMEADGVCPMCGMPMEMEGREGCPGAMCGGGAGQGRAQGQGMQGDCMTRRGMHGMQRGKMYNCVRLDADANGVYLLRAGMFTKFDHDLNKEKSWNAISETCAERDNACECAMKQMRRSGCPTCRMMMGTMQEERGIEDGSVAMWHRPARLTAGMARFQVQVDDVSEQGDADAGVTGYLYPKADVTAGIGIEMHSVGGGHFYGLVDIPGAGDWELSLRIMRPGMGDAKVYYDIPVQ